MSLSNPIVPVFFFYVSTIKAFCFHCSQSDRLELGVGRHSQESKIKNVPQPNATCSVWDMAGMTPFAIRYSRLSRALERPRIVRR